MYANNIQYNTIGTYRKLFNNVPNINGTITWLILSHWNPSLERLNLIHLNWSSRLDSVLMKLDLTLKLDLTYRPFVPTRTGWPHTLSLLRYFSSIP